VSEYTAAISGGETVTNLNPERHIVVSYAPGTDNLRVMPSDGEHHSGDAEALRQAADLLAPARRGAAVSEQVLCWCRPGAPELPVTAPHAKNDRCTPTGLLAAHREQQRQFDALILSGRQDDDDPDIT
jgi:hypothetical protein